MRFIKDLLLWIYWNPFKRIIQKMRAAHIYMIGRALGVLFYHLAREKRKKLGQELNFILRREANREESKEAVQAAFKVFMYNELEVLLFPVLNENIIASFVTCTGLENLDNALANGKGAMLLFAHFGANQMVMPAIGYRGYKMCQLSAPATVWKEVLPERRFTNIERRALKTRWEHERSLPVKHINIFGSIKEAFLCLKRNEILGVAVDGGGGKKNVTVNFLGRKALFSIGPIDIARRTGCAILPTFMVREESGRNTIMIQPPLEMDQGGDIYETITKTMRLFLQKFEDYVLAYPGFYMNFLALRSMMAEKGDTPLFPAEEG